MKGRTTAVGAAILLQIAGLAHGAEWSMEPQVTMTTQFDDNRRLTPAEHPAVFAGILGVNSDFSFRTPRASATVGAQYRLARYLGDSTLNNENRVFDFRGRYQMPRGSWSLDAKLTQDTTLTSQPDDTGQLTGFQGVPLVRNSLRLAPAASYSLDERWQASAALSYTSETFEDSGGGRFVDNLFYTANANLSVLPDPVSRVTLGLSASRLDVPDRDQTTDTAGLTIGYQRNFSPTWSGNGSFGYRRTRFRFLASGKIGEQIVEFPPGSGIFGSIPVFGLVQQQTIGSGVEYRFRLTRKFERGDLDATFSRATSPSSSGSLFERDRYGVRMKRSFSAKVSGDLAVNLSRNRALGGGTSANRDYLSGEAGMTWKLTEQLSIGGRYRYRRQKFQTADAPVESNSVSLTLTYNPGRRSVSR